MSTLTFGTEAPQHLQALARANQVRVAAACVKRELAAGRLSISDALHDDRAQAMTVFDLLKAQRRWGRERTVRVLARQRLKESKRVGSLTDRQRAALAEDLGLYTG